MNLFRNQLLVVFPFQRSLRQTAWGKQNGIADGKTLSKEYLLESVILSAPIGIISLDDDLNIRLINTRSRFYLEIPEAETKKIGGQPLLRYLEKFPEFLNDVTEQFNAGNMDFDLPEVKVSNRYLSVRCREIPGGALLTLINISKLKEIERNALNAMLDGQELERKRFAQEIHDGLGPLLSTLKLNIQSLQSKKDWRPDILYDKLQFLVEMVDVMTQDIRSISHALLPPVLVDFGLEAALNHLCFLTNSTDKVKVEFFASPNKERLNPHTELSLYRIAQELLNNAIKYSQAKTIVVQLFRHAHSIVLTVEDDGVGFDEQELKQKMKGIGILDVQGRVKSLDGQFMLESAPGEGVLTMVEIPLKNEGK